MREKQKRSLPFPKRAHNEKRAVSSSHSKKVSRKKLIIIGGSIVLVAAGATAGAFFLVRNTQPNEQSQLSGVAQEYQRQLPDLKQKVEDSKEDTAARTNYAVALYASKDLQEAKKQYEEIVKQDDTNATAYNNLGNVYRDLKENNKAVEAYKKAISLNPQNLNTYSNLANVQLYTLKDAAAAIATYNQGIEAIENNIQLKLLLAIAYEYDGQTEQARGTYQEILTEDPENTAAQAALERL